ncbi:MAG: nicotinate (nicotinamide) nucleotide adenylyltransferase [Aquificota bacterium]|nr:MAG: nicotinate (nicotinamide) nucleotide adenylyltransferase [Aquificota bacterium]
MIALYGGSFDPVHIGHLRIAEDIRETFSLRKVIFIPAYHSPLKPGSRASAEDRLNMLKLSIENNQYFDVDDIEIKRKGKSYTIDTILYYKEKIGYTPVFIVGTDAFLTLHLWKEPSRLLKNANFIVAGRDKTSFYEVVEYIKDYFPFVVLRKDTDIPKHEPSNVFYSDIRRLDVSSTEIRNRIKEGKSIKYLVLPEVEEYIFNKKLYGG